MLNILLLNFSGLIDQDTAATSGKDISSEDDLQISPALQPHLLIVLSTEPANGDQPDQRAVSAPHKHSPFFCLLRSFLCTSENRKGLSDQFTSPSSFHSSDGFASPFAGRSLKPETVAISGIPFMESSEGMEPVRQSGPFSQSAFADVGTYRESQPRSSGHEAPTTFLRLLGLSFPDAISEEVPKAPLPRGVSGGNYADPSCGSRSSKRAGSISSTVYKNPVVNVDVNVYGSGKTPNPSEKAGLESSPFPSNTQGDLASFSKLLSLLMLKMMSRSPEIRRRSYEADTIGERQLSSNFQSGFALSSNTFSPASSVGIFGPLETSDLSDKTVFEEQPSPHHAFVSTYDANTPFSRGHLIFIRRPQDEPGPVNSEQAPKSFSNFPADPLSSLAFMKPFVSNELNADHEPYSLSRHTSSAELPQPFPVESTGSVSNSESANPFSVHDLLSSTASDRSDKWHSAHLTGPSNPGDSNQFDVYGISRPAAASESAYFKKYDDSVEPLDNYKDWGYLLLGPSGIIRQDEDNSLS